MKQNSGIGGLRCVLVALAGLLGLGLLVMIGGAAWALTRLPDPSDELPEALNPARVMITQPVSGQSLPLEQTLTVYAKAFGEQPIRDVQLYVDGKLLEGQAADFPTGAVKTTSSWAWTPKDAGEHVLTARVRTVDGKGNISNAVVVKALAADQFPSFTSLAGIGKVTAPSEEEQKALSKEGTPMEPPAGSGENQEEGNEPTEEPPIKQPAEEPPKKWFPIIITWWIQQKLGNIMPLSMPEAAQINGLAKGCDGLLIVKDNAENETGFFLYRLDPGKFVFERVATLDGKGGKPVFSYVDKGLASGTYFYYVSAFNPKGEAPSNVVSLKVEGPVCDAAVPPIFEPDSIPLDPAQPVDKMYCYGSADDMPWVRLPSGQGVFLAPINGKFDLAPYWKLIPLPKPLPPKFHLNMECWGWSGETLIYLGASSKEYITAKEQKKQKPGEPEPTKPADGIGGGVELAPPYNLHFMNDFGECAKHITKDNKAGKEGCKREMGSETNLLDPEGFHTLLAWDWTQFGSCDPNSKPCSNTYKPVDTFKVRLIRPGQAEILEKGMLPDATYLPVTWLGGQVKPGDEYYVIATNDTYDLDSEDSNHIVVGDSELIVLYPADGDGKLIMKHIVKNKMGNGWIQTPPELDKWYYDNLTDQDLLAGYSREQHSDYLRTTYFYSRLRYNLPKDKYIHSANLIWNWSDMKAQGNGVGALNSACGVYLSTEAIDHPSIVPGYTWKDNTPYDVSGAVDQAVMMGWGQAQFWFTHNTHFSSLSYPNVCTIQFVEPLLVLRVSDLK